MGSDVPLNQLASLFPLRSRLTPDRSSSTKSRSSTSWVGGFGGEGDRFFWDDLKGRKTELRDELVSRGGSSTAVRLL